jgi:ABC-type multidrug transport system fused ATPase/permease subunit
MLDIIRYVKLEGIEKFFYRRLSELRKREVSHYLKTGFYFTFMVCLMWATSPFLQCLTFLMFVLTGHELTPEIAFTTISITALFDNSLILFPNAVNEVIQIMVSMRRVEKYLFAKEIKFDRIAEKSDSGVAVRIEGGNFYWKRELKKEQKDGDSDSDDEVEESVSSFREGEREEGRLSNSEVSQTILSESKANSSINFSQKDEQGKSIFSHTLKDINLKLKKGTFTMVLGDIGSGKSSLLLAIVNEMLAGDSSKITISGSIAYSCQKPWIMSKTLR